LSEQSIRHFNTLEKGGSPETPGARHCIIVFASAANAARNVAGLPAVARAARQAAIAGISECWIVAGPDWRPEARIDAEVNRLASGIHVHRLPATDLPARLAEESLLLVAGERLVAAHNIHDPLARDPFVVSGLGLAAAGAPEFFERIAAGRSAAELDEAERQIVAATAKLGDGIISRTINRPISQAISRALLRWPAIRPMHATVATALLAAAMVACLLTGGQTGLIAGALLFQTASIIDGVDGEIARATFRSSDAGALADSLVDAATNIGFIGGVVINLWIQGHSSAAIVGAAGLAMMALGLFLLGQRARSPGRQFTFNAVKEDLCADRSSPLQWLIWLTMRDFYAFAAVLFVLCGFAVQGLVAFGVVAAGWFVVVLGVLSRRRA
jgi:1L-myo-inositol 1-phosphate cytidylyltransferase / CDP-L-myo-inositol myo-inositolphosphotransferase